MLRIAELILIIVSAVVGVAVAGPENAGAIVVPKAASQGVSMAAHDLQDYVEKATGIKMPILTEETIPSATTKRIYLGATKAARDVGIDAAGLPRDAYRIRTTGNVTYLIGGDREGDPLSLGTPVGTLFAVYDVLDNNLGVRWLWPGLSGEFVPKGAALELKAGDETFLPRFRFCGLRTSRPEEILWMRRMRMHDADGIDYGHAFEKWGDLYFAKHPDWFEMDAKGVRHPGRSMCVSNPGFQKQIVENWWAEQQKHPGQRENLNICENDGPGACHCPNCLAWDGPAPSWPRSEPVDGN